MDSDVQYLLSLQAVRDNAGKVFAAAKEGNLVNFEYDADKMSNVADYVIGVITVCGT